MAYPYMLGWQKQIEDPRDDLFMFKASRDTAATLPSRYWPIAKLPPLKYQGNLGSCVPHGVRFCIVAADMAYGVNTPIEPSRLHIYYHGRELEGTISSDSGLTIRDGFKAVGKNGYCREDLWPYSDDGTTFKQRPSVEAETDAAPNKLPTPMYQAVSQDMIQVKSAIYEDVEHPRPVAFGFTCYESVFNAPNGDIPNPGGLDRVAGGHCICVCGWDDSSQRVLVSNWWKGWGVAGGYGTMSYSYLMSRLASDFWRVLKVPVDDRPVPPQPPTPTIKTITLSADLKAGTYSVT